MFNVKNVRHGIDLGKMSKADVLRRWPHADLTGKEFRAGKFVIVAAPVRKKAAPKKTENNEG